MEKNVCVCVFFCLAGGYLFKKVRDVKQIIYLPRQYPYVMLIYNYITIFVCVPRFMTSLL